MMKMKNRQRGALSLLWLAIGAAALAAAAMAALISMRHERNMFAVGWGLLVKSSASEAFQQKSKQALGAAGEPATGVMRSCVIQGRRVVSNVECSDGNRTSKAILITDTRGIEAPRVPVSPAPATMQEKMIENALR